METIINFIKRQKIPVFIIGVAIVCSSYGSMGLGYTPNGQGEMDTWCVYACAEVLTEAPMCRWAEYYITTYQHGDIVHCCDPTVEQTPSNLPGCSMGVYIDDIEPFFTEITGKTYYSYGFASWMTDQMLSRISYPCIGIIEGQYSYHCVVICGMSYSQSMYNPTVNVFIGTHGETVRMRAKLYI